MIPVSHTDIMAAKQLSTAQAISQVVNLIETQPDLYKGKMLTVLRKALLDASASSKLQPDRGIKPHLFNLEAVREFADFNPHHSACIEAKRNTTVGMGFKSERVSEVLSPLCEYSLADLLSQFAQDYWETGNAYIEVVRSPDDPTVITGLHHLAAANVYVEVENGDDPSKRHYRVIGGDDNSTVDARFARFGDLEDMARRNGIELDAVSEVIHWRMPTSRSKWYGYPEYFSATPSIELTQVMTQHEFNFFFNNGVPEYLLFLIGKHLDKKTWNQIVAMLQANQGQKNTRRSQAINLVGSKDEIQVQVEKLGQAGDAEKSPYAVHSEVTAANIVTAHGVPPILAGIQIPGKLGATNEGPNALALFQTLKIGPAQRALSELLANTLGNGEHQFQSPNGKQEKLERGEFLGTSVDEEQQAAQDERDRMTGMVSSAPTKKSRNNGFWTVLDEVNLGAMDTMARMREPVIGSDRDLNEGTLDSSDGRSKTGGKPAKGAGKAQAAGRGLPKPRGKR